LLFLIATSRHNTTNVLSLTQQLQQQPYIPEQQLQPPPLLKFHLKHVTNKNKTKHIMKIPHINIIYDKTTTSQQNSD
jgi:hypothetical protein